MVMALSPDGKGCGGDVAVGGDAEVDGLGPASGGGVGLGELAVGGGEADLESFCFAGPAFAFCFGDASQEVVANVGERPRWAGSILRSGHLMQECSWMQLVEYARPQSPRATRRRSKWPRNSSHSVSVGVRYSSLGRSSRRRAMNARWPRMTSSG